MTKAVKIRIYKKAVKPAVVFGSEMWVVTEMRMRRLGTDIHGAVVEQGIWRMINNQGSREMYKDPDIFADIKKGEIGMG